MLETQFRTLGKIFHAPAVPGTNEHLQRLQVELAEYFAAARQQFSVPLVYPGSDFQRQVWSELLKIPYGQTRSYQDLAATIGQRPAVRAVGRANGQNRIAILIPCHRVINKSGALCGYGGGLARKQYLLDLERTHAKARC